MEEFASMKIGEPILVALCSKIECLKEESSRTIDALVSVLWNGLVAPEVEWTDENVFEPTGDWVAEGLNEIDEGWDSLWW